MKKAFLVLTAMNFVAMVWFAQYVTPGWLIYLYVMGSFALVCTAMIIA